MFICLLCNKIYDEDSSMICLYILSGPRREFLGPGSECCMGPLSNEFRKVRRRRTRAPEAHPPRGVRGHAPPGKVLKVRLLESLWSLFPLPDTIVKSYNKLVIMHKNHYTITINRQ